MSGPERCIFCRGEFGPDQRRSKEHIWPHWMHSMLPAKPGIRRRFHTGELVGVYPFGRTLHEHFKPGVVCTSCNNGWMSRIESDVKPILQPLMREEPRQLSTTDQETLATWVCLKNMVAEFSDPTTRATSAADLDRMFAEHRPPTGATVWIGEHVSTEWILRYRHQGMRISHGSVQPTDDPPMNGQATSLGVGRVVFHLLTLPADFLYGGTPVPNGRIATRIKQIYPTSSPLDWPLAKTLSDQDVIDLGDKMAESYQRLVEAG